MSSYKITITGQVQGVGFRPFVYHTALKHAISGSVRNSPFGVVIECRGEAIEQFIADIRLTHPPFAKIDSFEIYASDEITDDGFIVANSSSDGDRVSFMMTDMATCHKCTKEMDDESNRRFNYPFINCTACGPRYSIIKSSPYDRVNTSMDRFKMCSECESEYRDISSRRFHAEPISCHKCGPKLSFLDSSGNHIDGDVIELASNALKSGDILAIKGIGGFHLVCDATNDEAIKRLREKKRRKLKPLAVMFRDLAHMGRFVDANVVERQMIDSDIKPIVIVKNATGLSQFVAPNIDRVGVFLAYSPLHRLLFKNIDFPIIATSANISGEPIIADVSDILDSLGGVVDFIVDFDREIINPIDDSVVEFVGENMIMHRHGRGFAPQYIKSTTTIDKQILALGVHQKSSISLNIGSHMMLGGYLGDLGTIKSIENYKNHIDRAIKYYDFTPDIAVRDLHDGYISSIEAKRFKNIKLQHHYGHILAVMAEYKMDEKVLAFAFDGSGDGDDGTIWGGEVFICDAHSFKRIGHIKPFRLLGAERAILEPRRVALSLMFDIYSLDEVLSIDNPTVRAFKPSEIIQLHHIYIKAINSPLTSSMGRVFDAVASMCDIVQVLDFEGQSGLYMQSYDDMSIDEPFSYSIDDGEIDISQMVVEILDLDDNRVIVSRFLSTIISIIEHFSFQYPELKIITSGGVFQNSSLMQRLFERIRVYTPQITPINDGAISLGQLYYGMKNYG